MITEISACHIQRRRHCLCQGSTVFTHFLSLYPSKEGLFPNLLLSQMSGINELDNLQEDPLLPPVFGTNDAPSTGDSEDRTKGVGVLARIYRNELILQASLNVGMGQL